MTANDTVDGRVEELGRASRRAAVLSLLGFLLVVAALTYAMLQLRNLERERQQLEQDVKVLQDSVGTLERRSQELLRTQNGVLDFLGGVTAGEQIRLIDRSVDWEQTKRYVMALESGPRKDAILAAVLLAWKELPFSLENRGPAVGWIRRTSSRLYCPELECR
jgi:hypothetical protein